MTIQSPEIGDLMHSWARDLYPIPRSLTGNGVRQSLAYLQKLIPEMTIHEVPSGTACFDWAVPDEWNIRDAYIADEAGNRVVDFKQHTLHVMGYSEPVDAWMTLDDLQPHLYSLPEMPDAIPYITSFYKRRWGFCLQHEKREALKPGRYHVVIDSTLEPGSLTYGEVILPGREQKEILLSTYICHPSMGNNELSGPVVTTALARWVAGLKDRRHTYRIVFCPETIGTILYISRNLEALKKNTIAAFVITCIGDERNYSLMRSRLGDTLADRVATHVFKHYAGNYREYAFLEGGGSDERQYGSPGVDLPVVSPMRTKHGDFPEYHTSKDDLSVITPAGLFGGYEVVRRCLEALEGNYRYRTKVLCEPQLGKRGLYPTLSTGKTSRDISVMRRVLSYSDGNHDLLQVAERIQVPVWECMEQAEKLFAGGVLERI